MKFFFFICTVFLCSALQGQTLETYTVKPNDNILEIIPLKVVFLYPSFTTGIVSFRDGRSVAGNLNYNLLIQAIQFIDGKGDTLALADENTIKQISITKDTFYYSDGYVKQIGNWTSVKLAERDFFKEFVQKPGSYGMSSAATAAHSINSVIIQGSTYKINSDKEVIMVKAKQYFIGNKYNEFVAADKKDLLKLFPKQKKNISEYLDKNPVDFNKKEDLNRLATFLHEL
jgi:hypothetical protein